MMKISLLMRLVATLVNENVATADAKITTKFKGFVEKGMLVGYSSELERQIFEERVWGTSFSTGRREGLWKMSLFGMQDGAEIAVVEHCVVKDMRFAVKLIGKAKKEMIVLSMSVLHEKSTSQMALVCAVPTNVQLTLEREVG